MRVRSSYKIQVKRKRNWKPLLWAALILILAAGLAYFFFFSDIFRIKNINARGTEKISGADLSGRVDNYLNGKILRIIPVNNYFLLSANKLAGYLHAEFPGAKEMEVKKKFPAALEAAAKDRKKIMNYCHAGKCYFLDDEGIIFEEAPAIYGGANLALEDNSGREIRMGDKAVEPSLIPFMLDASGKISEEANLSLVNFEVDSHPAMDLAAITSEDWKIILDFNSDLPAQVGALKQVLEEKIKDQRSRLEYVDLRVGNRVYYKYRGADPSTSSGQVPSTSSPQPELGTKAGQVPSAEAGQASSTSQNGAEKKEE